MPKKKHMPRIPIQMLTCKGKIPYPSIIEAVQAKDLLENDVPDKKFTFYICQHCGNYHVGGVRE